jgi:hypothetical protein
MVYTVDSDQLLNLSTATRLLGDIREIPDPIIRSEILTKAQILLTAFVLELKPFSVDQMSSTQQVLRSA